MLSISDLEKADRKIQSALAQVPHDLRGQGEPAWTREVKMRGGH